MIIQQIWLYPPLAFARIGRSDVPCDNYSWGANDDEPGGTGKTTIQPEETLHVAEDGTLQLSMPDKIAFKDRVGCKPICPFFELHGEWKQADGKVVRGPITPKVLELLGFTLDDVTWEVEVVNDKAYHMTLADGDRVEAKVQIKAGDTTKKPLQGISPTDAEKPLVLADQPIPLGAVQVTKATATFPELRLRFTPAKGFVYAPTNLAERLQDRTARRWRNLDIPSEQQILNPEANWSTYVESGSNSRTRPPALFVYVTDSAQRRHALGVIDDMCDGFIRCSIKDVATAQARIVVGPPDYAPDRRPFISLADGLKDRVSDPAEVAELVKDMEQTDREILDLFERAYETMGLSNLDVQNSRAHDMNLSYAGIAGIPPEEASKKAFPILPIAISPFPLTEFGRQHHRRFLSLAVLKDAFRENPELLEKLIRQPITEDKFFDQRMPALMRGSDGYALHLTQHQYNLLTAWVQRLREDVQQ